MATDKGLEEIPECKQAANSVVQLLVDYDCRAALEAQLRKGPG